MWSVPDVNHVSGTDLCITGGSGEIRTRDQRIKRSRASSKPHINQWSQGPKNDCAIECAIAYWCKVRICRPDTKLFSVTLSNAGHAKKCVGGTTYFPS